MHSTKESNKLQEQAEQDTREGVCSKQREQRLCSERKEWRLNGIKITLATNNPT